MIDLAANHETSALVVNAVHQDEPFGSAMRDAIDAEVESLADWLNLNTVRYP